MLVYVHVVPLFNATRTFAQMHIFTLLVQQITMYLFSGVFFSFFLLEKDGDTFQDSSVSTFGTSTPANNYREGLNQGVFCRVRCLNSIH